MGNFEPSFRTLRCSRTVPGPCIRSGVREPRRGAEKKIRTSRPRSSSIVQPCIRAMARFVKISFPPVSVIVTPRCIVLRTFPKTAIEWRHARRLHLCQVKSLSGRDIHGIRRAVPGQTQLAPW